MAIAAVPEYLQRDDREFYLSSPPGHRFLLYFPVWGENQEHGGKFDWRIEDRVPKIRQKEGKTQRDGWDDLDNRQYACTIAACRSPTYDESRPRARKPKADPGLKPWIPLMKGLLNRQTALADTVPTDNLLRLEATAIAPFTTGLGNEHPLENGFAFLNPYGLPYLPGSGVKGVLRQAARELASGAWGDTHGWSAEKTIPLMIGEGERRKPVLDERKQPVKLSLIDVLFGLESRDGDKEHVRGALSFWDVIPQIAGDSLMVEIMTPHQSHYYQQKMDRKTGDSISPHDSGQPNPIVFLTVPPGSHFVFHVVCDRAHLGRLAPDLLKHDEDGKPRWQGLLRAAFAHAFEWLGFGAKTAVGYGTMQAQALNTTTRGADAPRQSVAAASNDSPPTQGASPSPIHVKAKLTFDKGSKQVRASFIGPKFIRPFSRDIKEIEHLFQDREKLNRLMKKSNLENVELVFAEDRPGAEIIKII